MLHHILLRAVDAQLPIIPFSEMSKDGVNKLLVKVCEATHDEAREFFRVLKTDGRNIFVGQSYVLAVVSVCQTASDRDPQRDLALYSEHVDRCQINDCE